MCLKRLFDLLHERGILENVKSFLKLFPIFCPDDHKVFAALTGHPQGLVINDTSVCATFQSGSKFICCNFTHGYIL